MKSFSSLMIATLAAVLLASALPLVGSSRARRPEAGASGLPFTDIDDNEMFSESSPALNQYWGDKPFCYIGNRVVSEREIEAMKMDGYEVTDSDISDESIRLTLTVTCPHREDFFLMIRNCHVSTPDHLAKFLLKKESWMHKERVDYIFNENDFVQGENDSNAITVVCPKWTRTYHYKQSCWAMPFGKSKFKAIALNKVVELLNTTHEPVKESLWSEGVRKVRCYHTSFYMAKKGFEEFKKERDKREEIERERIVKMLQDRLDGMLWMVEFPWRARWGESSPLGLNRGGWRESSPLGLNLGGWRESDG